MELDFHVEPAWVGWRWQTGTNKGWAFGYYMALKAATLHGSKDAQKILNAYNFVENGWRWRGLR